MHSWQGCSLRVLLCSYTLYRIYCTYVATRSYCICSHSRTHTHARAISYSTAFQFFAMGIAPFAAGFIGPAFGLRVYFGLTILAMTAGLLLWLRDPARPQRRSRHRAPTGLSRFQVGRADDLAPFLGFGLDVGGEFLRRRRGGFDAACEQRIAHVGRVQYR